MSHYLPKCLKLLFAAALLVPTMQCARLGEAPVVFTEQNMLPAQPIVTGQMKPGMGADGGPASWSFWVKNRTAASDALLGSFTPFYKVNAVRLAVSANFVLYRDALESTINSAQANAVLTTLESAYTNLKSIYGAGEHPYANDGARIVILAINIIDDYSTTGNYVGGFFSPRDLYSNDFTRSLFTDPVALQQYSQYISALGGYSNEMNIIYYDLNPGYTTNAAQVNDIVIHELSHLFTYSKRVVKQRLVNHDLWIAEGIAENAPHATIGTASVQQLRLQQLASPSTIESYQAAPQLTDFLTWASKVVGYLQSNLFFNYLRHRAELHTAGGATQLFGELMTMPNQTIDGLEQLLVSRLSTDFPRLYGDFVITNYLMLLGIPINTATGWNAASVIPPDKYTMDKVNIGNSSATVDGSVIKAKYPSTIPFNFEAPVCADNTTGLRANSYVIFRHRVSSDITPPDTAGAAPVSGELSLKYIINLATEASLLSATPPTSIMLREYDAGQNIPLVSSLGLAPGDIIQVIAYNPNKTGSCRGLNGAYILQRNHSRWSGFQTAGTKPSPEFAWQSGTGAQWQTSQNGAYYSPTGIAAFTTGIAPLPDPGYTTQNFLYIADTNNMSLQRLDMDKATALGRLGSTSTTCPTAGLGWSNLAVRFTNNFCAHSFSSPQGVHVDSSHTIYVADSTNRRIVRYDSAGAFQGWLGFDENGWQAAGTVTHPNNLGTKATTAASRTGNTTAGDVTVSGLSATNDLLVGMYVNGSGITVGTTISAILDGSSIQISQVATSSGATTLTFSTGCAGYDPRMFSLPWAVTSDSNYLYVIDYDTHRLIRRDKASGNFSGYIGNGNNGWNLTPPALACTANTNFGITEGFFRGPQDAIVTGGKIYVSDQFNHRVVRIDASSGTFETWIGDGRTTWTSTATLPSGIPSSSNLHFKNPAGLATDGTYLFVADRLNNRIVKYRIDGTNCNAAKPALGAFCGWIGHGRIGWETILPAPAGDPYAGFTYYPPDYYAEPHWLAYMKSGPAASEKKTRNSYLYLTSIWNGRVTRINLDCVDAPATSACDAIYAFP